MTEVGIHMKLLQKIFKPKSERQINRLFSEAGEEFWRLGELPWQQHPRPQLKREKYELLNGNWSCNKKPILVPFPPQSLLSGYGEAQEEVFIYEKDFILPGSFDQERVLLHFGAVDQLARVWLNEIFLGEHEGGYLPFSFDITKAVKREGKNRLRVEAVDRLDQDYPYGKQTKTPGGMWYTPVSGIWQTVWLENVQDRYIERLILTPSLTGVDIEVVFNKEDREAEEEELYITVMVDTPERKEAVQVSVRGRKGHLEIEGLELPAGERHRAHHWTPEDPYLYELKIRCGKDCVESYFALRTIGIEKRQGISRVVLNGKPIFLHGILDQGYFCDGLFLPAGEQEYERDVLRMKELGFNLLRKHIKIEPEAFYYACDRLGMLVMQDMVNNGPYSFIRDTALPTLGFKKRKDSGKKIWEKRKEFFLEHSRQTLTHLYNHPCIVAYTIFNEGWGQFNSDRVYEEIKRLDPTRLADSTSGWFAQEKNDFDSEHIYFKVIPLTVKERPLFVSECGGYTLAVEGHLFSRDKDYGYGKCSTSVELTDKIVGMYEGMILPSIAAGLCGCVYTQLSDVEEEINGIYTYDRKICKVIGERMRAIAHKMKTKLEDAQNGEQ